MRLLFHFGSFIVFAVGLALVSVGVAVIDVAAGLIVAGAATSVCALAYERHNV